MQTVGIFDFEVLQTDAGLRLRVCFSCDRSGMQSPITVEELRVLAGWLSANANKIEKQILKEES